MVRLHASPSSCAAEGWKMEADKSGAVQSPSRRAQPRGLRSVDTGRTRVFVILCTSSVRVNSAPAPLIYAQKSGVREEVRAALRCASHSRWIVGKRSQHGSAWALINICLHVSALVVNQWQWHHSHFKCLASGLYCLSCIVNVWVMVKHSCIRHEGLRLSNRCIFCVAVHHIHEPWRQEVTSALASDLTVSQLMFTTFHFHCWNQSDVPSYACHRLRLLSYKSLWNYSSWLPLCVSCHHLDRTEDTFTVHLSCLPQRLLSLSTSLISKHQVHPTQMLVVFFFVFLSWCETVWQDSGGRWWNLTVACCLRFRESVMFINLWVSSYWWNPAPLCLKAASHSGSTEPFITGCSMSLLTAGICTF